MTAMMNQMEVKMMTTIVMLFTVKIKDKNSSKMPAACVYATAYFAYIFTNICMGTNM